MAPSDVMVVTTNSSALTVTWAADPAPVPPSYSVLYIATNLSQEGVWLRTSPAPQSARSILLSDLQPFTNYSIIVMATSTMCGSDQSAVITGVTGESPPTAPSNTMVTAALPTKVEVQWSRPASPNGIVTHYNVREGRVNSEASSCDVRVNSGIMTHMV